MAPFNRPGEFPTLKVRGVPPWPTVPIGSLTFTLHVFEGSGSAQRSAHATERTPEVTGRPRVPSGMFPPVHPAVGYLLYSLSRRLSDAGPPTAAATAAALLGGALPDLVDQPLYHLAGFPTTRTLGHSLLTVVPVALAVALLARRDRIGRPVAVAFVLGYLAHPAADALWPALLGLFEELGFLLWPITPMPEYQGTKPLAEVAGVTVTTLWVELPLLALAVLIWWRDGRPGLGALEDR